MPDQPTLTTPRLVLRSLALSDAPRVEELVSDADVASTTANIPHPYQAGGARTYIENHLAGSSATGEIVWAITERTAGLIGAIGLRHEASQMKAELGYWIGKPWWRQGYATEAGRAAIEYGFLGLGLNRIFAHHMVRNPASGRVLEKLGMRHEGSLRQHLRRDGRFEDLELYGILRSEFAREVPVP
jgi:RimJ/RimL family protein N-acetyltransferase